MLRSWTRRIAVVALVVVSYTSVTSGQTALAGPPPSQPSPKQCLDEWDDNDNYVGDGWVSARVRTASNGWFVGCGDERSGIIHIAHPDSTGREHPITSSTEGNFLKCWNAAVTRGSEHRMSDGRIRITWKPRGTAFARGYFAADRKFTWTFFTSKGAKGNDWSGCAKAVDGAVWNN